MKYEFKISELYNLMSKSEKTEMASMLTHDGFCADKKNGKVAVATRLTKNAAITSEFSADKYVSVKYQYNARGEYIGKYTITPKNYYGGKVYVNDDRYNAAQKILAKKGYKLKEIRSMNALNLTEKYNMVGVPQPGFGRNNWCQVLVEKDGKTYISGWVFRVGLSAAAFYARRGALHCANYLADSHDFRCAVLGSLCLAEQR